VDFHLPQEHYEYNTDSGSFAFRLHQLLRPGGKLIVCEHGINRWRKSDGNLIARIIQVTLMSLGWSLFMGDCHLDRRMQDVLEGAKEGSEWAATELVTVDAWGVLPYTVGYLMK
jgi:hypothetical protein